MELNLSVLLRNTIVRVPFQSWCCAGSTVLSATSCWPPWTTAWRTATTCSSWRTCCRLRTATSAGCRQAETSPMLRWRDRPTSLCYRWGWTISSNEMTVAIRFSLVHSDRFTISIKDDQVYYRSRTQRWCCPASDVTRARLNNGVWLVEKHPCSVRLENVV